MAHLVYNRRMCAHGLALLRLVAPLSILACASSASQSRDGTLAPGAEPGFAEHAAGTWGEGAVEGTSRRSSSQAVPSVGAEDLTPVWEHAPSAPLPSAVEIEHARRLGRAELFDRPPPSDREKIIQNLTVLPVIPELLQTPTWCGLMHVSPLPADRMAAILAVAEHPRILVELASDPASPLRSHAAAVAAFLRIEAVVPALLSMLDSPLPSGPWRARGDQPELSSVAKLRANRYAEAVAAWRVALVGLASFDRRELFPRLMAILFDPPTWFAPPEQVDLAQDRVEVDRARAAVYRMLVRAGAAADWQGLTAFEVQTLSQNPGPPVEAHGDTAGVAAAVVRYFAGVEHRGRARGASPIDQVALRGERARARIDVGDGPTRELLRVSLRRQNGIWRVDDYWACAGEQDP